MCVAMYGLACMACVLSEVFVTARFYHRGLEAQRVAAFFRLVAPPTPPSVRRRSTSARAGSPPRSPVTTTRDHHSIHTLARAPPTPSARLEGGLAIAPPPPNSRARNDRFIPASLRDPRCAPDARRVSHDFPSARLRAGTVEQVADRRRHRKSSYATGVPVDSRAVTQASVQQGIVGGWKGAYAHERRRTSVHRARVLFARTDPVSAGVLLSGSRDSTPIHDHSSLGCHWDDRRQRAQCDQRGLLRPSRRRSRPNYCELEQTRGTDAVEGGRRGVSSYCPTRGYEEMCIPNALERFVFSAYPSCPAIPATSRRSRCTSMGATSTKSTYSMRSTSKSARCACYKAAVDAPGDQPFDDLTVAPLRRDRARSAVTTRATTPTREAMREILDGRRAQRAASLLGRAERLSDLLAKRSQLGAKTKLEKYESQLVDIGTVSEVDDGKVTRKMPRRAADGVGGRWLGTIVLLEKGRRSSFERVSEAASVLEEGTPAPAPAWEAHNARSVEDDAGPRQHRQGGQEARWCSSGRCSTPPPRARPADGAADAAAERARLRNDQTALARHAFEETPNTESTTARRSDG